VRKKNRRKAVPVPVQTCGKHTQTLIESIVKKNSNFCQTMLPDLLSMQNVLSIKVLPSTKLANKGK